MKKYFCALSLLSFLALKVNSQNKVTILFTNSYCGGAKPNQEILNELSIPRLFNNSCVIFKNNLTNKKTKAKTDNDAGAKVKLKTGSYSVFIHKTSSNKNGAQFNIKCKENLSTIIGNFDYTNSKQNDTIKLHFPCIPCDKHRE